MTNWAPWQLELFKSFLALALLVVTWLFGQRIITFWDRQKKRQELDIAATEKFQQLYGDLKEVARLWRSAKRPKGAAAPPPVTLQWDLLVRATAAESRYEPLVIKLATERELTSAQLRTLGIFRQAVQAIREAIRIGEVVPASGFGAEYLAFNDLAAEVACLLGLSTAHTEVDPETAKMNLERIALVRAGDWRDLVGVYRTDKVPAIQDGGHRRLHPKEP